MISRDKIYALWRHKFIQRFCGSPLVDGRAIIQIASKKNRVRLFS